MNKLFGGLIVPTLILGLTGCSEGTDEPVLPPAISAAEVDVVHLTDRTTDLSRSFQEERYSTMPKTPSETRRNLYKFIDPEYHRSLAKKAEAGDAEAQFEITFLGGNPVDPSLYNSDDGQRIFDPCSANHWLNSAAQQRYGPALAEMTMVFLSGGEMGQPNRRLATFYFWTWSQLKGFGLKNYRTDRHIPLSKNEMQMWSDEFTIWDVSTAVSMEPKSCPACSRNCVALVEN